MKMYISILLYHSLWKLTHLAGTLIDFFYSVLHRLEEWFLRSYDLFTMRQEKDEIAYLTKQMSKLQKLPKHVCIILGLSERHCPKALSKIAFYCLIMHINCISFYDPTDKFSLDQLQPPMTVTSARTKNKRLLWSMTGTREEGTYKNGLEKTLEIALIKRSDGKPLVAEVCRDLFTQRHKTEVQEALKDRARLTETISQSLQKKLHNLSNPDLVILFNSFMCTFGLLPWHTGFSEFHLIKRGNYFNAKMFAKVLFRFAKCDQRFGR